jgi:hypothetical protein
MKAVFQVKRAAVPALSACLLLSTSGCMSAEYRALGCAGRVQIGMTAEEVEKELGKPAVREYRAGKGAGEVWTCKYSAGVDPRPHHVLMKSLALALLILMVAAAASASGSHSGLGFLSGPDESASVVILFDADTGRVRWVALGQ